MGLWGLVVYICVWDVYRFGMDIFRVFFLHFRTDFLREWMLWLSEFVSFLDIGLSSTGSL